MNAILLIIQDIVFKRIGQKLLFVGYWGGDEMTRPQFQEKVQLQNGSYNPQVQQAGDSDPTQYGLYVIDQPEMYNGASWDRVRNNTQGTLLSSLARTSAGISPVQNNYNARGVLITVNVTAVSGTGGLIPKIQTIDPITGAGVNYSVDPATITAIGETSYLFYPGSSLTLNSTTNLKAVEGIAIPKQWQLYMYNVDTSSYTYSVAYQYIL